MTVGRIMRVAAGILACAIPIAAIACGKRGDTGPERASGYVEATEVRVAPQVGGRLTEVAVAEGDRVTAGAVIARIDTTDIDLAIRRAEADRDQAVAALRLLQAGARAEDVRQARASTRPGSAPAPPPKPSRACAPARAPRRSRAHARASPPPMRRLPRSRRTARTPC